jgi:MFS family permease
MLAVPERRSEWRGTAVAAVGAAIAGGGAALIGAFINLIEKHASGGETSRNFATLVPTLAALITTLMVILTAAVAFLRPGRIRPGFEAGEISTGEIERIRSEIASAKAGAPVPFEIEQLAGYYSLTLGQARISFWFSLIFAAIGFLVIVGGAALYSEGGIIAASIKIVSGIVIDAVSALFFVQSRRAQDSMSAFFEKLRNDRQFAEARKICDELSDDIIKDHLKTILVIHYSGLGATPMIDALPSLTKHEMAVHNS